MIRITGISLAPGQGEDALRREAARALRLKPEKIRSLRIARRSVDARKKPEVRLIYAVDVDVGEHEAAILKSCRCPRASLAPTDCYAPPQPASPPKERPVVVGFGPGGMFAALVLAMAGQRPLVLERGEDALTRRAKVERFFSGGPLEPECNVQFGEGGAGTFSDGKLHTGIHNPRIAWVLEQFVLAGAPEEILYDAKPHVGTDVLVEVVQSLRRRIEALGGEVRFRSCVTGLRQAGGRLRALTLAGGEEIPCSAAVFAIGHSARDTFRMLEAAGLPMEPKPFAMGARIEHSQSWLNRQQYGGENPALPPADYKLAEHLEDGTVYTFCMCPGGYVVAAASETGRIVTNGMSNAAREGSNANSALLVTVNPRDFPYPGPLGGVRWQEEIEGRAFRLSGSYRAPAQRLGDFLAGRPSTGPGVIVPTYRPGVVWCDIHAVLPEKITAAMAQAMPGLNRRLPGFANPDAVLTGPETRSSSPVRLLRDGSGQSAIRGLYPCGEGAGYAGGIMSAAVDGIQIAEKIIGQGEKYGQ